MQSYPTSSLRFHLPAFFLWTLFLFLFFATLILGNGRLPHSDLTAQFHAFAQHQAREMSAGRLPLWSDGSYGGFPFVADPQSAVFYAPRWLTVFLSAPWGFPFYALEMEAVAHIWLIGIFTYAFAFYLTRQRTAALLSASAFGLGGYLTSYPLLQLAILETITWLPFILLCVRLAFSPQATVRPLLLAGIFLALALTAGHPQTFLQIAYLTVGYFLYLAWRHRWSLWTTIKAGIPIFLIAIMGSAATWLPALTYAQNTTRSDIDYNFVAAGFPLLDSIQLFLPASRSLWSPFYVGVATLLLAWLAWWGRQQLDRREISFWAGATLFLLILSLGDAGILFQLAYRLLPGFSLFRRQERWLGLVCFALALLAGYGVVAWRQWNENQPRKGIYGGIGLVLGGIFFSALTLAIAPQLAFRPWLMITLRQLAILMVMSLLILTPLWLKKWRGERSQTLLSLTNASFLIIPVLFVDLFLATVPAINRIPESPDVFWPAYDWVTKLKTDPEVGRVDSLNIFWSNFGEIYGLRDIRGISPLKLEALAEVEKLPLPRQWELLHVTHVFWPTPPVPDTPMTLVGDIPKTIVPGEERTARIFKLDQPQPYTWLVYEVVNAPDTATAFTQLADPTFDLDTQAVMVDAGIPPLSPPTSSPIVTIHEQRAGHLALTTTTDSESLLVISEWAYPGWQATIDNVSTDILTVNGGLQAILVPAGSSSIKLTYAPYDVTVGIALSLITLFLTALFLVRPFSISIKPARGWSLPRWHLPHLRLSTPPSAIHMLLMLFVLGGFALRVATASIQELRGDEGFSYRYASLPIDEIIPALIPVGEPHSPLHYLVLNRLIHLTGDNELSMRLPAIFASLLLIPLMYQWGRLIAGKRAGLLAALFILLSESQVWLGQDVRNQYAVATMATVLATILLIKAVRRSTVGMWVAYALAAALTVHGHYYGVFALLAHGLYVVLTPTHRSKLPAWLGSGILAAALFAPWPLLTWSQLFQGHLAESVTVDLAQHLTNVGLELTVGSAFPHAYARWWLVVALACLMAGIAHLRKRQPVWTTLLVTWLLLATWGIFVVRLRRSIFNDYYMAVVAPVWWLLISVGILSLWQKRHRMLAMASLTLLLTANMVSLTNYYTRPAQYARLVGYRSIVDHIAQHDTTHDLFLAHFPDPAFGYYLDRLDLPRTRQPDTYGMTESELHTILADLASQYDRVWFVPVRHNIVDPNDTVPNWLNYHLLHEEDLVFDNLRLQAFRPLASVADVMTSHEAALANGVVLEGSYMTLNGVPIKAGDALVAKAGDRLDVTLIWHTERALTTDYKVFVHLVNEAGILVTQHDSDPLAGTRPTTTWQVGERLIDRYTLTIPADVGEQGATIYAGMYDPISIERQPFLETNQTEWTLRSLQLSP